MRKLIGLSVVAGFAFIAAPAATREAAKATAPYAPITLAG